MQQDRLEKQRFRQFNTPQRENADRQYIFDEKNYYKEQPLNQQFSYYDNNFGTSSKYKQKDFSTPQSNKYDAYPYAKLTNKIDGYKYQYQPQVKVRELFEIQSYSKTNYYKVEQDLIQQLNLHTFQVELQIQKEQMIQNNLKLNDVESSIDKKINLKFQLSEIQQLRNNKQYLIQKIRLIQEIEQLKICFSEMKQYLKFHQNNSALLIQKQYQIPPIELQTWQQNQNIQQGREIKLEQKIQNLQKEFESQRPLNYDNQFSSINEQINEIKNKMAELEYQAKEFDAQRLQKLHMKIEETSNFIKADFSKFKSQFEENNRKLNHLQNQIQNQLQKEDIEQIINQQILALQQQILQLQDQKLNNLTKQQITQSESKNGQELNKFKDQYNTLLEKMNQNKEQINQKLFKSQQKHSEDLNQFKIQLDQQKKDQHELNNQQLQIDLKLKEVESMNAQTKQFLNQQQKISQDNQQLQNQFAQQKSIDDALIKIQGESDKKYLAQQSFQEMLSKINEQIMQLKKQTQEQTNGVQSIQNQFMQQKQEFEINKQTMTEQTQIIQNRINEVKQIIVKEFPIFIQPFEDSHNKIHQQIQNQLDQQDQKQKQLHITINTMTEKYNLQSKMIEQIKQDQQNQLLKQQQEELEKQKEEQNKVQQNNEQVSEEHKQIQQRDPNSNDVQRLKMVQEKINDIYNQSCRKRGVSGEFQKFLRDEQNINELYRNYSIRSSEVKNKLKQVCNGFRQARGDGNCFYTAFGFQFFNILLNKYQQMEYQQFIDSMDKIITFKINYGQNSIENQELEQQCWNELKYRLQYLRNLESNVRQQEFLKHFSAYEQEYDKIDGCFYGLSTIFFRNIANYVVENSEWKTAVYDQQTLLNWEEECNNNEIVIQLLSQFLKVFIKLLFFENGGFQIRQYSEDQPHQIILLITPGHYNVGINKIVEQEEQEEQS